MTDSDQPVDNDTKRRQKLSGMLKPSRGAMHVIGVLGLIAAAFATVVFIGMGILSSRNEYFKQHSLRELDRIAAELTATQGSVAQAATLHFVPQQLHFSLSQQVECLVATTEIAGARRQPMSITYYFTDPEATRQIAEWYAAQTPRNPPPNSTTPPQVQSRALPSDICAYQRPLGLSTNDARVRLDNGRFRLERTAQLRSILWPMSTRGQPNSAELAGCVRNPDNAAGAAVPTDLRSFINRCIFLAAMEDMQDQTYTYSDPQHLQEIVQQSIDAALRSNTIRINVSTPIEALDFESALENFDAIQIIGSATDGDRPILLHQIGRVPAWEQGDEEAEARMLHMLEELAGQAPNRAAGAGDAARDNALFPGRTDFLDDSRIASMDDLIVFQRSFRSLVGLNCNPCRIIGIVERSKFNNRVRKLDGMHATIFLIVILSVIGLIPLLHLRLRKRLDASGRTTQYITWISLTLLAASASVAAFASWASVSSRNKGAETAGEAIENMRTAFADELRDTLQLVGRIGTQIRESPTTFPSPLTVPSTGEPNSNWNVSAATPPHEAAVAMLASAWRGEPSAAIVDTVSFYRRDGFLDRRSFRVVASRFPAYGTPLSDRPYFLRARNRDFDTIDLDRCRGKDSLRFILDRVLARPDGAPRVVWVMPARQSCASTLAVPGAIAATRPVPGRTAATKIPAAVEPVLFEDTGGFYDPTGREFLIASGTLRAFLGRPLPPGFSFAVIDPARPPDEANVLFHSDSRSELVERFENEIDGSREFQSIARQALSQSENSQTGRRRQPKDRQKAENSEDLEDDLARARLQMDTNYRARPARLTIARLHDDIDWLLVVIEDRNDASYAIWRAVTFGYGVWFFGLFVAALFLLAFTAFRRNALDRRPGLSLWPVGRLESFTPPRLERHAKMRQDVVDAAKRRDRHIWGVLLASLIGIPGAEGASRITLAFAAVLAVISARSYFLGMTAANHEEAKRMDRGIVVAAAFLLAVTVPFFFDAIAADYRVRAYQEGQAGLDWPLKGRAVLVLLAMAGIAFFLYTAWSYSRRVGRRPEALAAALLSRNMAEARAESTTSNFGATIPERLGDMASAVRRTATDVPSRIRRWLSAPRRPRVDIGWMAALLIIGGMPAAAGFLDSYDQDRILHLERNEQIITRAAEERTEALEFLNLTRLIQIPKEIVSHSEGVMDLSGRERPNTARCMTLSCLVLSYLNLSEDALEYSDSVPFHMSDAFKTRGVTEWIVFPLFVVLPLVILAIVLAYFRKQYFNPPPLLSPGKDPDFDPPLSFTRRDFITKALLPAAEGKHPILPFKPAGGNRHLILGIGLGLRNEWAQGKGKRLADIPGIEWVDLVQLRDTDVSPDEAGKSATGTSEPRSDTPPDVQSAPANSAPAKVVVIGNLELALQVQDGGQTAQRAFRAIKRFSEASTFRQNDYHVFLLADIDPLDRIALLWEQQNDTTPLTTAWKWAELLEEFTLFPIRHGARISTGTEESLVLRTIMEELGVLDIGFARELRDRLISRLRQARAGNEPREAERIVSFISEQMSDYYQKLWASSSDEERVILYRIARDCHLKMPESRAIRSLLSRGLLIRVPEYRLMNRSFTRYVCRIGESTHLQRAADKIGGLDHVWPLIRYPLAALAASAVVLLQVLAPSAPTGAAGLLPALLALIPAMLGKWFQERLSTS